MTAALGARNDVHCVSIEHKLGIHASPTAVLAYGDHGGAVGYLVGEENRGLEYMFIMMNLARFSVGHRRRGHCRALVSACAWHTRAIACRAGRRTGQDGVDARTIIQHPDMRRMLMTMKSQTRSDARGSLRHRRGD